jgi:hypothetical protein
MSEPSARARTEIGAPPEKIYELVSDLPGMARLAEEFRGGSWLGGVSTARVGARFRGHNRRGWRRWSTTATVIDTDPGQRFAFTVTSFGIPVARWQYDIEATGDGCRVTESTWDRRPAWFAPIAGLATGARNRAEVNQRNMERTLERLKSAAEAAVR